ncbi:hypothetical protein ACN28S_19425 [Cystobacter fuscus]
MSSQEAEELLARFLASTSPSDFVRLQHGVDMARLLEGLDDWSAVRLGALGPMPAPAADVVNRKRASFLTTCVREDGSALAEVFALFVLHSSSDQDLKQVLRALARDKRLGSTLGDMAVVREQLRRRGLPLSNFPDRPERPREDMARGAREALSEAVSTTPCFSGARPRTTTRASGSCPCPTSEPSRRWRARWCSRPSLQAT